MQPPNSGTGHQTEGDNEDPNHPSRGPAGSSGDHEQPLSIDRMFLLALVVGVFGGLGAIVFRSIIALFQNIFFYGNFALSYDPDAHIEPSPFGAFIILVPVVGAILVTWITRTLAPEARGHGVPEVLGAIYHRRGHISPVVVLAKSLASAISVGTGGSVGREGPIIQIGSAFGSTLGQLTRIPTRQRITLIGAGAAAGRVRARLHHRVSGRSRGSVGPECRGGCKHRHGRVHRRSQSPLGGYRPREPRAGAD